MGSSHYSELILDIKAVGVKKTTKQLADLKMQVGHLGSVAQRIGGNFQILKTKLRNFVNTFQAWALSVMFFGMLIQRTFTNIAKSGIKTFKEISDSASAQVQALGRLEAAWTFVKWSVGNAITTALLPLMPIILTIVAAVTDWVNAHPKLAGQLVLVGILVGALLFLIGALSLGVFGVIAMFEKFSKIRPFWAVMVGVLTIIALIAIWKSDFLQTNEKIAASLAVLGIGIMAIALMFGFWPVAVVAAVVAMIGLIWLFRDQVGDLMVALVVKWAIFNLDMQIAFFEMLGNLELKARDFAKKLIEIFNMIPGINIDTSGWKDTPTIADVYSAQLQVTRDNLQSGLEGMNDNQTFTERFAELMGLAAREAQEANPMESILNDALLNTDLLNQDLAGQNQIVIENVEVNNPTNVTEGVEQAMQEVLDGINNVVGTQNMPNIGG